MDHILTFTKPESDVIFLFSSFINLASQADEKPNKWVNTLQRYTIAGVTQNVGEYDGKFFLF